MIKAHIDYPDRRLTVHRNPNCSHAKVGPGENHRHVILDADSISKELHRFKDGTHRFAAEAGLDDMWLIVDFFDEAFEQAVVAYLGNLVGRHDEPVRPFELRVHC